MPILVKRDDVRSERKAEAYPGQLWPVNGLININFS